MTNAELDAELRSARVAAQLLADSKRRTPDVIVRHLLAVQAQDFASVPLALRARSRGLERADLYAALDSGELVISWLNRGTLHLVCREDYAWLLALTAPTVETANARRLHQEGVSDPAKGVRAIARTLEDGPLLRAEIGDRIGFKGQALTHLLFAATSGGLVVRGPVRGREQTFGLTRDHLGELPRVDRDAALAELARRYFASHSPATEADLAYWSKLPLRDVRAGMRAAGCPPENAVTPRQTGDTPLPPKLLPPFDPYIMGWKDRSFAIPSEMTKRVIPGGGMFRAVVLLDGQVAGTWSRAGGRAQIDEGAAASARGGLDSERDDVERFLA